MFTVTHLLFIHGNALGGQLGQHVIQVVGVWVAVAGEVRAELCLVMDFIPDDGV